MDEVAVMKAEYNIASMKRRGHPLRKKISKGEIKLVDLFNVSDNEFNEKLASLPLDEKELVIAVRKRKTSTGIK